MVTQRIASPLWLNLLVYPFNGLVITNYGQIISIRPQKQPSGQSDGCSGSGSGSGCGCGCGSIPFNTQTSVSVSQVYPSGHFSSSGNHIEFHYVDKMIDHEPRT